MADKLTQAREALELAQEELWRIGSSEVEHEALWSVRRSLAALSDGEAVEPVAERDRQLSQASHGAVRECATEGCGGVATVRFERGGIGSEYCGSCYLKVQAIPQDGLASLEPAAPGREEAIGQELRDTAKAMGAAVARNMPLVGTADLSPPTGKDAVQAVTEEDVMPAIRQVLADYAHEHRKASIWELEARIEAALSAALQQKETGR